MDGKKHLQEIYEKIMKCPVRYGTFHKTIFHIHTPQSYDYKLRRDWSEKDYQSLSEEQIMEICYENNVFPRDVNINDLYSEDDMDIYANKKEWLSFTLLAHTLYANDYEIVLIADHNTIQGIAKLRIAISGIEKLNKKHPYPEVIGGVEISCADRLHVVGIFDYDDEDQRSKIEEWLRGILINEEYGTYETSINVMDYLDNIGAVSYIAHINTSDLFTSEYLSGGYKKKLFAQKYSSIIGVNELSKKDSYIKKMKSNNVYSEVVIDNDAHNIDDVSKNYFWIKSGKRNFSTVKEALLDFDVSVAYDVSNFKKIYMLGMYIEPSEGGFLSGKNGNGPFVIRFSNALNCLIGGRGTGKSTALELLDYILGAHVDNENKLDFICKNGNAFVLFKDDSKEYLIEMAMPRKENKEDSILMRFGENPDGKYYYDYRFDEKKVSDFAKRKFLFIREIIHNKGEIDFITVNEKNRVLNELYNNHYSVNKLVQTASGEDINSFIYTMMFQNAVIANPQNVIRARKKAGLVKTVEDIKKILKTRKDEVNEILEPFNQNQNEILKIVYSQDETPREPDIQQWLIGDRMSKKKRYLEFPITQEYAVDYLLSVYDKIGIFELLSYALDNKKREQRYKESIVDFLIDKTISKLQQEEIIDTLYEHLVTKTNINMILDYLKMMVRQIEKFSLYFNINNKEGEKLAPNFKDVLVISLGQKVVAMLDFVLGYGSFINDYRPLLIDQPEDNLDSQYIYKNLVRQLRDVKKNRQIIIATHNATIVTNAMADQVSVLQSDGKKGWIEKTGYPSEIQIKKSIINYLEGGPDSFNHKMRIYRPALMKNK